jgi:signal transduction histidine kinase/CheY-like chemotaxis protein/putative methionine-R-sulfoxide reductase with GAF domain
VADLIGKSFVPLIHPDDLEMVTEVFQKTLSGEPQNYIVRIFNIEGKIVFLSVNTAPIYKKGKVDGTVSFGRDITKRKLAEDALKRRATQLSTLSEVGRQITSLLELDPLLDYIVHIIRKSFDYRFVSVLLIDTVTEGLALRAGAGYNSESVKSLRLRMGKGICGMVASRGQPMLVGDVSKEPAYHIVEELSETCSEIAVPIRFKGKIEGVLDVQSAKLEAFDQDDLFILQAVADQAAIAIENSRLYEQAQQEIIERKQAEDEIRSAKEEWERTFEAFEDIITIQDPKLRIIRMNRAATQALKSDTVVPIGTYCYELFGNKTRPCKECPVRQTIQKHSSHTAEIQSHLLDKTYQVTGSPIFDNRGNLIGVVHVARDITDQKKMEAQFRQAQKMEALGTLAGGIVHDFNNLLTGIQGRTSLMLIDTNSSHPHYAHLKGIEEHVISSAGLTKQLLGFARGGKYEVKPMNLNELVDRSSNMFGRTKKEIKIHKKFQEKISIVDVDGGQIEQVLLNLYVNAWQAMPESGELYIKTENITLDENYVKPFKVKEGEYVKISVTDTGVGMDKKTMERIFDPFFTTKEMGRGTGLGLASVYGIIKNHGGIINVYSEVDEGTTFNIYLPVSFKKAQKKKELHEEIIKGKETILVVDDEDMIIAVSKEMLGNMGYEVLTAKSGKEGIKIYKENKDKIELVILDMIMPDMGGGETFGQLKEINPKIKVLLSSGYSIHEKATRLLARGCDGFLQKPFNIKQLSQKIREILNSKKIE